MNLHQFPLLWITLISFAVLNIVRAEPGDSDLFVENSFDYLIERYSGLIRTSVDYFQKFTPLIGKMNLLALNEWQESQSEDDFEVFFNKKYATTIDKYVNYVTNAYSQYHQSDSMTEKTAIHESTKEMLADKNDGDCHTIIEMVNFSTYMAYDVGIMVTMVEHDMRMLQSLVAAETDDDLAEKYVTIQLIALKAKKVLYDAGSVLMPKRNIHDWLSIYESANELLVNRLKDLDQLYDQLMGVIDPNVIGTTESASKAAQVTDNYQILDSPEDPNKTKMGYCQHYSPIPMNFIPWAEEDIIVSDYVLHEDSDQEKKDELFRQFQARTLTNVRGDGNCFYRAVALNLGLGQECHHMIRNAALLGMQSLRFRSGNPRIFTTGEVDSYIAGQTIANSWADNYSMYALSRVLGVHIVLYTEQTNRITSSAPRGKSNDIPTIFLYHDGSHYQAFI